MSRKVIVSQWCVVFIAMQVALAQSEVLGDRVRAQTAELNQKGAADIQAGRLEEAKAAFLSAFHLDPKSSDAYENLSLLFLLEGDDTNAYSWAVRLLKLKPESYNGRFVAGIAAINQHKFSQGRDLLFPLVRHDTSDALAIAAFGTALKQTGSQAAAARLQANLSDLSVEPHDLLLAGQIFRETHLKNIAETWLETAIQSTATPATPEILSTLAAMYVDEGRNADAGLLYRKLLATKPNDVNALVELSELDRKQGDREQSLADLYRAKKLASTDNTTLIRFSQVCMGRHMYVDARDALEKVVTGDPHNREAWYQLGLAQYRIGETDAAGNDFRQALKLNPDDEWSRVGLGAVLSAIGRLQQAVTELARVLKRDPHCGAAYYYLGRIHRDEGKLQLAFSELEQAVKYSGNDARPLTALGQVQLALHDLPSARRSLQKAIQLDPTSATAHYNFAMLMRDEGQTEQAKNEIELYRKYNDEENKQGIVGIARKGEWDYPGFIAPN